MFHVACFRGHSRISQRLWSGMLGARCASRNRHGQWHSVLSGGSRESPDRQIKSLLNARVRASGTVMEKHDPMELKMPVGDKNQMVVRVEGGYKQVTIQTLEKIPAKRLPS